ncbi:uncharacterized protein [Miscanthus floridulus]|uniref:uncharacterized protein n=1 Tax=Miscanthus floridulus TaxID=154761 RepID=UPI0034579656
MMIWIEGIKVVVFKALLYFVYMDELPPMDDLVRATGDGKQPSSSSMARLAGDLLVAAKRYQLVERMRPLCENLLCELITSENATGTLELEEGTKRRREQPQRQQQCGNGNGNKNPSMWHADSMCIGWLDVQRAGSVLYVSFGSWVGSIGPDKVRELALGLEGTGRPFLWALKRDTS